MHHPRDQLQERLRARFNNTAAVITCLCWAQPQRTLRVPMNWPWKVSIARSAASRDLKLAKP